jgi:hypothetical protein
MLTAFATAAVTRAPAWALTMRSGASAAGSGGSIPAASG